MIFFGTRPEITKLAPVIRKIEASKLKLTLIHSGQHYDYQMSNIFLEELDLKNIDDNLEVGSGSHGVQTAKMLESYEKKILHYKPDIVLAQGDTNSVVAAGIVCAKLNVPFGHVEAGIRSYDMTMPEEINRRLAGIGAAIHFSPTKQAIVNLYYEGIDPKRIFLTGNTAVDSTLENSKIALKKSKIIEKLNLPSDKPLMIVTAHRPANVDEKEPLKQICDALITLDEFTIVYPVHPRTVKKLKEFNLENSLKNAEHIYLTEPLGYLDFLLLMQKCALVLTDSGGLQEEAVTLKKPCVTLRENTERPETVKLGVNFLVGFNYDKIVTTVRKVVDDKEIQKKLNTLINPFGDGKASQRILELIIEHLEKGDLPFKKPSFFAKGSAEFRLLKIDREISKTELEQQQKGIITLTYDEKGIPQPIPEKIPKDWSVRILQ